MLILANRKGRCLDLRKIDRLLVFARVFRRAKVKGGQIRILGPFECGIEAIKDFDAGTLLIGPQVDGLQGATYS